MDLHIRFQIGHFKYINVFLISAICLLHNVYSIQSLNIKVGEIKIGLDRGFAKHRLNFVYITGPYKSPQWRGKLHGTLHSATQP